MNAAQLLMLRDAVASVSLSHKEGCGCLTCRAAAGDTDAFMQIVIASEEEAS